MRSSALIATFSQKISTDALAIGSMAAVSIYRQKRKSEQLPGAIDPRREPAKRCREKSIKIAAFLKARLFLCSFL